MAGPVVSHLVRHIDKNRGAKGAAEVWRMFATMLRDHADMRAIDVTRTVAFGLIDSFSHIPVQAAKLRAEIGSA